MNGLRPPTEATLFPKIVVDAEVRRVETGFKAEREAYLLTTHGPHVFDTIRYLSGEMIGVRAQVAHVGADYTWHGTARLTATGGLVSFEITTNVNAEWSEGFEIYGEKGHISVRTFFPFFNRASEVSVFDEQTKTTVRPAFGDTNAYERQLEAFARTIAIGGTANPTANEGVCAVRMIEAVAASAANDGAEVAL
jgi:predicted dehydrogenase